VHFSSKSSINQKAYHERVLYGKNFYILFSRNSIVITECAIFFIEQRSHSLSGPDPSLPRQLQCIMEDPDNPPQPPQSDAAGATAEKMTAQTAAQAAQAATGTTTARQKRANMVKKAIRDGTHEKYYLNLIKYAL
jgi:anti-sigma28 factor (negative regulator of flagellin synthesis)